ncbi:MAG TPA: glycoside hydrolase family 9 protein [Polyangiaceae bacterium]|nr:glycoside hydrolase family 9 protein [Polyangiaceae bacterium]
MSHYSLLRRYGSTLAILASVACSGASSGPKQPASPAASQQTPKEYPKGGELLKRSTFKDGRSVPWLPLYITPAAGDAGAKDGVYCLKIDKFGKNQWDIQFRHREMTIVKDHKYAVRFTAWANKPIGIKAKVGMAGPPYTEHWGSDFDLTTTPTEFMDEFMGWAPDDPTAEFAFHLNDPEAKAPVEVCFNELHLTDPAYVPPPPSADSKPAAIRVNQVGYLPNEIKRATWVLEGPDAEARAKTALPFEVVDSAGTVVHKGNTEPFGLDKTSGAFVQRLDFSAVTKPGKNLKIRIVGKDGASDQFVSDPFSIDANLLKPLARDAMRFFYYSRSGIALKQPYVENAMWERVEGHPTDKQTACAADAKCSYTIDASGGWYDAGDYGKYVVNGGLSTWMLLNLWEVAQLQGLKLMGTKDRELNIPESGNGTPDLLDEAKWEMQWMLKMQVPEGQPMAGMAHHKMHDEEWSALGTLPVVSEKVKRTLRPVSTAATLNLAATAAQASRIFAKFDPKFSQTCLTAAKRAWDAAAKNPSLFITAADNKGGGAYDDSNMSDELFWAATELYLTTGDKAYFESLSKSPHYLHPRKEASDKGLPQSWDWRTMDTLGSVDIAFDRKRFPAEAREATKKAIVEIADSYLALTKADAFGQPFSGTKYIWGSNSFMLNNAIMLAYAHALTKDKKYLEGAVSSLDYLLGRNAVGRSHVSGYGTRPLKNPHHRMWARSADPKFPPPPPGALAGGPNSSLEDPYAKAANLGCIGQSCYVDHSDAYSVNEVAINWNAELAWITAYLNGVVGGGK